MMKHSFAFTILHLLANLVASSKCTSSELQNTVEMVSKWIPFERDIFELLEERLRFQEKRSNKLYRLREVFIDYTFSKKRDLEGAFNYQNHPVNSFVIVNRLVNALNEIESIDEQVGEVFSKQLNYKQLKEEHILPTMEDLVESGEALLRLQAFYDLSIDEIVSGKLELGKLETIQNSRNFTEIRALPMSGYDCFELGKVAYGNEDWSNSISWFEYAIKLVETQGLDTDTAEILEYLAFAAYKNNQIEYAIELTKSWLTKDPHNERALNNLENYVEELLQEEEEDSIETTETLDQNNKKSYDDMYKPGGIFQTNNYSLTDDEVVRNLCRQVSSSPAGYTCSQKTLPAIMSTLPEIRLETLNTEPKIIRIHNFITEREAELMRSLALEKLERSTIQSKLGLVTSNFRIAKTAWLSSRRYSVARRVRDRVRKLLNFDLTGAEDLQVVKYGVGGFYGPHLDSARETFNESDLAVSRKALRQDDRLATILIYLNSITAGGSTVFPRLNLTVEPIKLSAIVWFNLLEYGSSDWRTLHTGCPILLGTKWIATIWPREDANIFSRPYRLKLE